MQDLLCALLGKFFKMRIVTFIVQHRGTRKTACAKLRIKIDVLRVLGECVEMLAQNAVLVHRVSQRHDSKVVCRDVIGIQIAGGIARDQKLFFHILSFSFFSFFLLRKQCALLSEDCALFALARLV